jgi:molecular chaperone GrpE
MVEENNPKDESPELIDAAAVAKAEAAIRQALDEAQGEAQGEAQEAGAEEDVVVDLETLAEEVVQLKDQVLRSAAEMENVRRRAQRDVENAHKFAVEKLINDLFPVLDSLEKTVETASTIEGASAITEGVGLSLKLFTETLAKSGVEQIDPLGEPFDPQLHEALTVVPNPDAEPNSIMDVMQKGYVLNGRLVRAAKVIVVKPPED